MTSTASTMPLALRRTVASTIRKACEPGAILHNLLDGKPKMLVSIWCGPATNEALERDYDPERGDGTTMFIGANSPLYHLRRQPMPEHTNVRQGIPTWLLRADNYERLDDPGTVQTLGYGLIHPLFSTATFDTYTLKGCWESRHYFHDPRLAEKQIDSENAAAQIEYLQSIGANSFEAQLMAPVWNPPCNHVSMEDVPFRPIPKPDNDRPWWTRLGNG